MPVYSERYSDRYLFLIVHKQPNYARVYRHFYSTTRISSPRRYIKNTGFLGSKVRSASKNTILPSLINTVQSYSLHSRVHPPPFSSVSALLTFFFLPPRGVHVRIDKALDKERTAKFDIHDICNEWPDRWQVARNRFIGAGKSGIAAITKRQRGIDT